MTQANDSAIHPLLSQRRSPYHWDGARNVSPDDLRALFEAARWTMSSYNEQPWRYIVGDRARDPELWQRVLNVLVEGNQAWAKNVPVLVLGVFSKSFAYNGKDNKAAAHDLGAASASLTVEATARGLHVHQMIGLEPEKAHAEFGLDDDLEVFTALAIGYAAEDDGSELAERDRRPRERKPLEDLILAGQI